MASQAQLADRYRRQQALLSAAVARDVVTVWMSGFDPGRPALWRSVLGLLRPLVLSRFNASAGLARSFYREARRAAKAPGLFEPSFPTPPPVELIEVTAGITGPGAYDRSLRSGRAPEAAKRNAGVQLAGSMTRIVNNGGRQTIADAVEEDPDAIGWMRTTDADPCAWCAMMASRGAVYRSAETAGRAKNDRFVGEGLFKWHDHCGCVATPVWDPNDRRLDRADALYEEWVRETQGHSGKDAINAWRRYWENRNQTAQGAV